MYDFHLIFIRNGPGYLLYAGSDLAGQASPRPIEPLEPFRFGPSGAGNTRDIESDGIAPEAEEERRAVWVGRALYEAVFRDGVDELFRTALTIARERQTGLRLSIRSPHAREVHELPWELLHDGRAFLAHSLQTPIVRFVEQEEPVHEIQVKPPLRVLLTTSSPSGERRLRVEREEEHLRTALAPLGEQGDLVVEHQLSHERLRYLLLRAQQQDRPFHVWHHGGHGGLSQTDDMPDFRLILTDRHGAPQKTSLSDLEPTFRNCRDLRIAVLNVCHGGSAVGLATMLARLNVPGVVGFREQVLDRSALTFAETFYRNLAHLSFEAAASRARLELLSCEPRGLDWAQLLVFSRTTSILPLLAPVEDREKPKVPAGRSTTVVFNEKDGKGPRVEIGSLNTGTESAPGGDLQAQFNSEASSDGKVVKIAEMNLPSASAEDLVRELFGSPRARPEGDQ